MPDSFPTLSRMKFYILAFFILPFPGSSENSFSLSDYGSKNNPVQKIQFGFLSFI